MSQAIDLRERQSWLYGGLAVLLVAVWLATLAGRPLFNPDEGRYAEIPREMLSGGDWVIPHLNGLDYIEKPPLQYWATAAMYRVFGVSEFSARLYTALTALGTVALVGLLGGRLGGRDTGRRAVAVASGMVMVVVLGQLTTLDMSLTFYMTASMTGFVLAQQPGERWRQWMLMAWIAAALGVLTKGLVAAAIPAAVLIIYSLCSRDFTPWRKLNLSFGLPLFLSITVPWHWLAALRRSDFLQFFFVHEHFARYLTPIADRQEHWWFFGMVFLIGTVPWTVPALRVLIGGWRRRADGTPFSTAFFLWIWVLFVCVFFSLSDSKLMPYILPAMPALAVLIAAQPIATLKRDFLITAILTAIAGVALGVASFYEPALVPASPARPYFLSLAKPLREVAVLLIVSGAFVWVQGARDATRAGVFLGVGWCLAGLLLIRTATLLAPIYSGIDLANALPPGSGDAPLYSVRTYDQTLPFYLRRTVTLVGYRGELDYGLHQAPGGEIADIDEFLRLWESQARAFAVMDKRTFNNFKERGVPMRNVGENVAHVMVARQ
ncbi:MAG: glycosyltransferase family 39 protein [Pseudomonadota bacterium]|nr:glycosyltransferase family 39 protein [Pseudomonadota bacterium]